MPDNLSEKIRMCKQRAAECERRAESQADPAIRKALLDSGERWLNLAQSYEIVERVTRLKSTPTTPEDR